MCIISLLLVKFFSCVDLIFSSLSSLIFFSSDKLYEAIVRTTSRETEAITGSLAALQNPITMRSYSVLYKYKAPWLQSDRLAQWPHLLLPPRLGRSPQWPHLLLLPRLGRSLQSLLPPRLLQSLPLPQPDLEFPGGPEVPGPPAFPEVP